MLNILSHGAASALPPLLIVHGLFGSARNWGAIAKRLAAERLVLAVDMRNHGESAWSAQMDYPAMAADLAEVIAAHGGRADVLGHSMGGKAAMWLALSEPGRVERLVIADIAPVAYRHSHAGLVAAMAGLPIADLTSRTEADRRLAAAVPDAGTRAFLLQSLDLREGPPRWKLNLPVLGAAMDTLTGWPGAPGGAAPFPRPTLVLTGARSDYVRAEDRAGICALFPQARFETIADAGHWLHAEQPRAFTEAVAAFLRR